MERHRTRPGSWQHQMISLINVKNVWRNLPWNHQVIWFVFFVFCFVCFVHALYSDHFICDPQIWLSCILHHVAKVSMCNIHIFYLNHQQSEQWHKWCWMSNSSTCRGQHLCTKCKRITYRLLYFYTLLEHFSLDYLKIKLKSKNKNINRTMNYYFNH